MARIRVEEKLLGAVDSITESEDQFGACTELADEILYVEIQSGELN
jgi:hypothetical protein